MFSSHNKPAPIRLISPETKRTGRVMIEDPIQMNLLTGDKGGAMADHCGTIFHNISKTESALSTLPQS